MLIFLIILLIILLIAAVGVGVFLLTIIFGAPYVPSGDDYVRKMIELATVKSGEIVVDLGSGNGKVVIALAKLGVETHGYEINPFLVLLSRKNIKKAGLNGHAFIHWKNFWHADFSRYDVVFVFGITGIMGKLEKKLRKELKLGARVVCNAFTFPNWKPTEESDGVYLYSKTI